MSGTPRGKSQPPTASVKSYVKPSTRSLQAHRCGHATEVEPGGTYFLAIPSISSTWFAAMTLRSSLWRTVGGDPGTGGRDSETPSDKPLERPGVTALRPTDHASAGRSAPSR